MSGGQPHHNDEPERAPSHWVGHKAANEDRYSIKGNQCVCADVMSVCEIIKTWISNLLTRPASLEMLRIGVYTNYPGRPFMTWLMASWHTFHKQKSQAPGTHCTR